MAEKLNRTTAGLAGLLSGINSGRQQGLQNQIALQQLQNQNQTTQWANPYRAPGELDRLKVEADPVKRAIASMMASANQIYAPKPTQAQGTTTQDVVANGQQGVAGVVNNTQPVANIPVYKGSYSGSDLHYSPSTGKYYDSEGNEV